MNPIDEIAHVIQLSVAPVFLLTGVATLLNVLSGRLARIVDRARVLHDRWDASAASLPKEHLEELHILERRGMLIYRAVTFSTISALLVCVVIAVLFASAVLHTSHRLLVSGLFILAMLTSITSLSFFLREVFLAIHSFKVSLALHETGRGDQEKTGPG